MKPENERLDLLARLEDLCLQWGTGGSNTTEKLYHLSIVTGVPIPINQLEMALLELELHPPPPA